MTSRYRWLGFYSGRRLRDYLGVVLVTTALGQPKQNREQNPTSIPRCAVTEMSRTELVLDGHSIYVEPLALTPGRAGLFLAGSPSYAILNGGIKTAATFGVVIDGKGTAHRIPWPIESHNLGDMRAVELNNGSWGVIFAEFAEGSRFPHPIVRSFWYGIFDGLLWHGLQQLPFSRVERLDPSVMSQMVLYKDTIAVGLPIKELRGSDGAGVLIGENGRWTMSELTPGGTAYVAPAHSTALGWHVLVVRGDSVSTNAPWVYRKVDSTPTTPVGGVTWSTVGELNRPDRAEVQGPRFMSSRTGWAISWIAVPSHEHGDDVLDVMSGTTEQTPSLMISRAITPGRNAAPYASNGVFAIDTSVRSYAATNGPDGAFVWVSDHIGKTSRATESELRVTLSQAGPPTLIGVIPNPFMGAFSVAMPTSSELILSGPLVRGLGTPAFTLRTLMIRLRMRCTAPQ